MSGELKDLMDGVAAGEMAGARIDLAAAQERGRRRRAHLRLVSSRVLLLAAAAAAVLGVVLPVLFVVAAERPAHRDDRHATARQDWTWLPADRVPPATTVHMPRARMLLAMLAPDGSTSDGNNSRPIHGVPGRGPVVLSADRKTYAALPWEPSAGLYTLSRDGSRVAWTTWKVKARRATIVAHVLSLADGTVRRLTLPVETVDERPTALFFDRTDGRRLIIFTRGLTGVRPLQAHLWSWRPDSAARVRELCSCLPTPFGLDSDGRVWQASNKLGRYPGTERSAASVGVPTWGGDNWGNDLATERLVVSTAGQVASAFSFEASELVITGTQGRRTIPIDPSATGVTARSTDRAVTPTIVSALDWTSTGVVVAYEQDAFGPDHANSLLLVDPVTGRARVLGRGDGRAIPLAVSRALT